MVGMQLRAELKRLRVGVCASFTFSNPSKTTLHRETKSGLLLTFDPHIPIILFVYSTSRVPHLCIFCSGM